jgi:hypothetical protein
VPMSVTNRHQRRAHAKSHDSEMFVAPAETPIQVRQLITAIYKALPKRRTAGDYRDRVYALILAAASEAACYESTEEFDEFVDTIGSAFREMATTARAANRLRGIGTAGEVFADR